MQNIKSLGVETTDHRKGIGSYKKTAMQTELNKFKNHLKIIGYGKSTQTMISSYTADFTDYYPNKKAQETTREDIINYYEYLSTRPHKRKDGGLSGASLMHHIYSIRTFLNYLEQIGKIQENPISGLNFPKHKNKVREILTIEEIQALYKQAETYREKAILGIFYGCGLRRTEAQALNIKDISFREKLLYVRHGKGKKRRVIPINEKVKQDIENYISYERYTETSTTQSRNKQALIINNTGQRMRGETYNKIVKKLIKKAGIQKEISLHNLRHTIATQLLNNGMSVEYVRDFLGHKHLEATQIYTRIISYEL